MASKSGHVWSLGLAFGCNAVANIVCCADSEDIQNEWLDAFHRLGIDVATKLGADDEEYVDSCIEIYGDALKDRLEHKIQRLDEEHAEHTAR